MRDELHLAADTSEISNENSRHFLLASSGTSSCFVIDIQYKRLQTSIQSIKHQTLDFSASPLNFSFCSKRNSSTTIPSSSSSSPVPPPSSFSLPLVVSSGTSSLPNNSHPLVNSNLSGRVSNIDIGSFVCLFSFFSCVEKVSHEFLSSGEKQVKYQGFDDYAALLINHNRWKDIRNQIISLLRAEQLADNYYNTNNNNNNNSLNNNGSNNSSVAPPSLPLSNESRQLNNPIIPILALPPLPLIDPHTQNDRVMTVLEDYIRSIILSSTPHSYSAADYSSSLAFLLIRLK